jgi:predicted metalloprotease with PDZ domain
MRRYLLLAVFGLPLLAVSSLAGCSPMVLEQPFGYSSDELPGGSSYLGVDTRDLTSERVTALHLKDEQGVEVTMVDQDAPAGKAGIKEHDVILSVNGEKVESVEQLRRLVREIPTGRTVTIALSRNGQPVTVKTQLAARAKEFAFSNKDFHFEMPPIPPVPVIADMDLPVSVVVVHSAMRSGLMVENLTPQLGDYFGAKNGQGILVRSVEKGSLAEKAGFHAGDVIVRVNGENIGDSSDFSRVLRSRKENNVNIGILREKREQTLTITLPDRKQSQDVREESWDMPQISEETRAELKNLKAEMAEMRPQIALAVDRARLQSSELKKELAVMQKNFAVQKDAMQKQGEVIHKKLKEQMDQMRKNWGADI